MNIDTLILSGGGPSGIAYFGILKALFEKNIINNNLDGIQEIITTSVGIIPSIFLILKLPLNIGENIIMRYNLNFLTDMDLITIDNILVYFGLFDNSAISDLIQSILKNLINVNPRVAFLYNLLGLILSAQKKTDEAMKY